MKNSFLILAFFLLASLSHATDAQQHQNAVCEKNNFTYDVYVPGKIAGNVCEIYINNRPNPSWSAKIDKTYCLRTLKEVFKKKQCGNDISQITLSNPLQKPSEQSTNDMNLATLPKHLQRFSEYFTPEFEKVLKAAVSSSSAEELRSKNLNLNVKNTIGTSLLAYLIIMNIVAEEYDVVERVLEAGADPNQITTIRSGLGGVALIAAAGNGHLRPIKALVKAGADVTKRDSNGELAVMRISGRGRKIINDAKKEKEFLEMLELLTPENADLLHVYDPYNLSNPLERAAVLGDKLSLLFFAERVDLNHQNYRGNTLLHIALRTGKTPETKKGFIQDPEIIKALISSGGENIAIRNWHGNTALDIAKINKNNQAIIKLLEDNQPVRKFTEDGQPIKPKEKDTAEVTNQPDQPQKATNTNNPYHPGSTQIAVPVRQKSKEDQSDQERISTRPTQEITKPL